MKFLSYIIKQNQHAYFLYSEQTIYLVASHKVLHKQGCKRQLQRNH